MLKKFMISLVVFSTVACQSSNTPKEEKFVNPLFYRTMEPLSRSNLFWELTLTPTKMIEHNTKTDTIVESSCFLLENEEMSITLNCEDVYKPPYRIKFVCTRIPRQDKPHYNGGGYVRCATAYEIKEKRGQFRENFSSEVSYIVPLD